MGAPVGYTCSSIDSVIDAIKETQKSIAHILNYISDIKRTEENERLLDSIESETNNIDHRIYRLEDVMEEIRDANSQLRDWGDELESKLDDIKNVLY